MQKILFVLATALLLLSIGCKKDEVRAVLHSPAAVKGFTTTSSQVVLTIVRCGPSGIMLTMTA